MSTTALLVIDMMNAYEHDDADALAESVTTMAGPLGGLIEFARSRDDVDLIYGNDNYGDFAATREALVRRALNGARPDLVKPIVPEDEGRSWRRRVTARSTPLPWTIC